MATNALLCRNGMRISLAGKRLWRRRRRLMTGFRRRNGRGADFLHRIMDRLGRLIFLDRATDCRRRSADTRLTGFGDRGAIREIVWSCWEIGGSGWRNCSSMWSMWGLRRITPMLWRKRLRYIFAEGRSLGPWRRFGLS